MNDTIVIGGDISLVSVIDGTCELQLICDGEAGTVIQYDTHRTYAGPYEITPSSETQVVPISNYIAASDIKINPVPSCYGLITWNGSFLQIS